MNPMRGFNVSGQLLARENGQGISARPGTPELSAARIRARN